MIKINDIQIAPTNICLDVYMGDEIEQIGEYIDKRYDYEFDDNHYNSFFAVMRERNGFCHQVVDEDERIKLIIWILEPDDIITLSHEVIHATWYIQHMTDFKFSWDSQEIQTYLHDYMLYQILKAKTND